jgi:hypothetical protein
MMENDSFTEVTSQGWLSRIGESIKGILFGLILFIVAFPLLWWNEGRSVERYNSLKEGQGLVISISSTPVEPENNGKLVHTQGLATTDEKLKDDTFGVSANAIKLQRQVLMYQWEESVESKTKEEIGGTKKTIKTYSYAKDWNIRPINSSNFKQPGYDNPAMLYQSKTLYAKHVYLGAFKLNPSQIRKIDGETELSLHNITPPSKISGKTLTKNDNGFYLGDNPNTPQIGDLKISFAMIGATNISLVAQQQGNSFGLYQTNAGGTIDLLKSRLMDANALFEAAHKENTLLTWGLRLGGFLIMWLGISLIFKPLSILASVLPFLGNLIAMGTGILAFFIAVPSTLITIALAWITYRPLLAGGLIAVAVIALAAMKFVPRHNPVPVEAK